MRRTSAIATLIGATTLTVAACSTAKDGSASPVVTAGTTATTTSSQHPRAYSTSPSASPSAYASTSRDESTAATSGASGGPAIRSIVVEISSSAKVGPDLLQMNSGGVDVDVDVRSRGQDGDLHGDDCMMVVDVTGPGNYDERWRSSSCSDSFNYLHHPALKAVGTYTVSVSVTPPGVSTATTTTHNFRVIGKGE